MRLIIFVILLMVSALGAQCAQSMQGLATSGADSSAFIAEDADSRRESLGPDGQVLVAYSHLSDNSGDTVALKGQTRQLASQASVTLLNVADEIARSHAVIAQDFGWQRLHLQIDPQALSTHLTHQPLGTGAITPSRALLFGLLKTLEDESSPETPMAIARGALAATASAGSAADQIDKGQVQNFLRDHLNRSATRLSLFLAERDDGFPPEQGESPETNWIFALDIPSLSDHIYWIVVEKSGAHRSYVYGFN